MKRILTITAAVLFTLGLRADEGMWLLPLLEQMNGSAMGKAGLRLSPEEIYSINNTSLKDAIVHFGGGCTGEVISDQGLLVTNHHCGYSSIQRLSTPEHNYLMDGYWALSLSDEIPAPGLTVTFMEYMADVTDRIKEAEAKAAIRYKRSPERAKKAVDKARKAIITEFTKLYPGCDVNIYPFFNENVYYLIVNKVYRDIRFVGAPPASLGKFGGETDNWMWPRHTCDFSMFRIYAGADNEPADYSPANVPLSPRRHLRISTAGVRQNDFSMIMGYPGRTVRFQTAVQLKQMIRNNRITIDARTVRQNIMWDEMCADPTVKLQYANKYASSSNAWKKYQGMELAFSKLGIISREIAKERKFTEWVSETPERTEAYGNALADIEAAVEASAAPSEANQLYRETLRNIEIVGLANRYAILSKGSVPDSAALAELYKDYYAPLDRRVTAALLKHYRKRADQSAYPGSFGDGYEDFATLDIDAYVDSLFERSVFTSPERLAAASKAEIRRDPVQDLSLSLEELSSRLIKAVPARTDLDKASKVFTAGLLEWEAGKPSYPDANSTMRLTYGNVLPYSPADGILYRHYTTLNGVMQKEDPNNPEFIVPAPLKDLYKARDFGRWADPSDGMLHTCFLTNNDITGGNSGSPVLNADGALIGLAFDGNWESMSSDVMFEPDLQRCICVDIRYVLFIVDKFGGAQNIIDELDII